MGELATCIGSVELWGNLLLALVQWNYGGTCYLHWFSRIMGELATCIGSVELWGNLLLALVQ